MNDITTRSYSAAQLDLIKRTVAKDCNKEEFDLFIEICKQNGLDPFRKQIHGMVMNKNKPDKRQLVTVTGIDGYRAKARRCGDYRPADDEPVFTILDELKDPDSNPHGIEKCKVTVYQFGPDKQWYPVVGTAYWDEFAPLDWKKVDWVESGETWPNGKPKMKKVPDLSQGKTLAEGNWRTMPKQMIAKCAEAQALRKGWPEEFGGLYVHEEIDRVVTDASASEIVEDYEEQERMKKVSGNNSITVVFQISEGMVNVPLGEFADRVLEHIKNFENADDIQYWQEMNKLALQTFWAKAPNDALELKKEIELAKERADKVAVAS